MDIKASDDSKHWFEFDRQQHVGLSVHCAYLLRYDLVAQEPTLLSRYGALCAHNDVC